MRLGERIAALYERIAEAVIAFNPASALDPWLLRNHPHLWRIRVALVVSYAALISGALYLLGRSAEITSLGHVPTVVDLETSILWISLVSLLILSSWINRNFRTGVEHGKWRTGLTVFVAYLACFAALNFVPTAFYLGKIDRLAEYARPDAQRTAQRLQKRYIELTAPDELGFYSYGLERLPQAVGDFGAVAERYGLDICIDVHSQSDEGAVAISPVCGRRGALDRIRKIGEPTRPADVVPNADLYADNMHFIPANGARDSSQADMTPDALVSALATLGYAETVRKGGRSSPFHPLRPQRLMLVGIVSLIATLASFHRLAPPQSPAPRVPGRRGLARVFERMRGRRSYNFPHGVRPRLRQLAFALVPMSLLFLLAAALGLTNPLAGAAEGSRNLGVALTDSVIEFLTLLATLAIAGVAILLTKNFYRRFPFPLVISLRGNYYFPLVAGGLVATAGIMLLAQLQDSLDYALSVIFAAALVIVGLIASVEGCWFGAYLRWSLQGSSRPAAIMVALRTLAYLAILCASAVVAFFLAEGIYYAIEIPALQHPLTTAEIGPDTFLSRLEANSPDILNTAVNTLALLIILTAACRLYWLIVGKRHIIVARLGMLALFFGLGGYAFGSLVGMLTAVSEVALGIGMEDSLISRLVQSLAMLGLAMIAFSALFAWLFRPFYKYWGRQIYEPQPV